MVATRASRKKMPSCTADDAALGLTLLKDGRHCALTDEQLGKLAVCTSIDYWCLGSCDSCRQSTIDAIRLEEIRGKDPANSYSLTIGAGQTVALCDAHREW